MNGPLVIAIVLAIPALLLVAAHLLAGVRVDVERRGEWDGISAFARFRATLADGLSGVAAEPTASASRASGGAAVRLGGSGVLGTHPAQSSEPPRA